MNERDIEKHLVKRVKALGGEVRKVQWIGRRGAPDRLVLWSLGGWWCSAWVELKAPGKVATAQQHREHERLRAAGQKVVVINSIDQVESLLT